MICPVCKENNEKSTVTSHGSMSTLMAYMSTYDEEGHMHYHDGNRITTDFTCSNGHKFASVRKGSPCPSYPEHCDYDGGDEEIRIMKE